MPTFYVPLEKAYIKLKPPDDYDRCEIAGYLPLQAADQQAAQDEIARLLGADRGELQSTDKRIVWDEDPPDDDEDDEESWEYEDFSFGLREGEDAENGDEPSDWSEKPE